MFRKDAEHRAFKAPLLVEKSICNVFDAVAKAQELRLPVSRHCAFATSNFVHSRTADLTFDRLVVIQHGEFEHHPIIVVTQGLSPRQRHRSSPKILVRPCIMDDGVAQTIKLKHASAAALMNLSTMRRLRSRRDLV